jgi:hypothetical protein
MAEVEHRTGEVFGITRDIPLNYVVRKSVDDQFIDSLSRDKHIVIYGSSKQGKTCLRKHCLEDRDYITVHCSNRWSLADLHANILKRAGYELTVSTKESATGHKKLSAKFGAKVLGVDVGVGGEKQDGKTDEVTKEPLELEPEDVNDVIAALEAIDFEQYVVLEDFHYLPTDTQKEFAVSLKAFHENSDITFIIIGVWLEENRLTVYNGDLTGRITSINADAWSDAELSEVMEAGEALLAIEFTDKFRGELITAAQGSVYVLQEACYLACTRAGIWFTRDDHPVLGDGIDTSALVQTVVEQSTGRYNSFLVQFAEGFQTTDLELYRWLLLPILIAKPADLEKGLKFYHIRKCLHAEHPQHERVNPGSITQALQYSASLQVKKDIKPIVLDYDQTNVRLNVVDRAFLIWLAHQNRDHLLEMIGLPTQEEMQGTTPDLFST